MSLRTVPRSTLTVLVVWLVFLVAIAAAAAAMVQERYRAAIDTGSEQATRFVTGAVAAVNVSLLGVDVLLAGLDAAMGLSDQMLEWVDPVQASRTMLVATRNNLLVNNVALVDALGRSIASSASGGTTLPWSLPGAFVTDALAQPVSTLVVSMPTVSFTTAETVVYFGRHIRLADGSKLVAVAEVNVSKITALLVQGADIEGLQTTLERRSGQPVAAVPLPAPDARVTPAPLVDGVQLQGPWLDVPARVTGVPAVVVARGTLYGDLFVTASIPLSTVLADWRYDAKLIEALAGLFALMVTGAAGFALWYLRQQRNAQTTMVQSRQTLDEALESMISGFLLLDAQQKVVTWNRRYVEFHPWLQERIREGVPFEWLAQATAQHELPDATAHEIATWVRVRLERLAQPGENYQLHTSDGRTLEIIERRTPPGGYVIVYHDVTKLHNAMVDVEHLAYYDHLTQLPNRRLLTDRLRQAIAAIQRSGRYGALLFLDLDHFKTLNDTAGHLVGDQLLQQVAQRLLACVREEDTVARLGGDEFVVMLQGLDSDVQDAAQATRKVGQAILAALQEPFALGNQEHVCSGSIGATLFGAGIPVSAEDLLKQADIAMYQVKQAGRNALCFFDPQMLASVTARVEMERDLRQGLAQQQFVLHYQMQVDGAGHTVGAEVLIRWHHPVRGMVPPGQFIAAAEDTGLILPIGDWVLRTACTQLERWQHDARTAQLSVSVNVSARQFRAADFVQQVQGILEQTGAPVARLKLELTESLVLDNVQDTIAKMHALKTLGVRFAMDDFGTGYSSLAYLSRLPLDQLKIDQSFVRLMERQAADAAVVTTIISLAQSLGLEVMAEGVETQAQRDFLAQHGCSHCQGYLFGRPVPVGEFEAALPT